MRLFKWGWNLIKGRPNQSYTVNVNSLTIFFSMTLSFNDWSNLLKSSKLSNVVSLNMFSAFNRFPKLRSMIVKHICMVKCNTLLKVSFLCSYGSALGVFIISQTSKPLPCLFKPPIITLTGLIFVKKTISNISQELNFVIKITFSHIFLFRNKNNCLQGYNAN